MIQEGVGDSRKLHETVGGFKKLQEASEICRSLLVAPGGTVKTQDNLGVARRLQENLGISRSFRMLRHALRICTIIQEVLGFPGNLYAYAGGSRNLWEALDFTNLQEALEVSRNFQECKRFHEALWNSVTFIQVLGGIRRLQHALGNSRGISESLKASRNVREALRRSRRVQEDIGKSKRLKGIQKYLGV